MRVALAIGGCIIVLLGLFGLGTMVTQQSVLTAGGFPGWALAGIAVLFALALGLGITLLCEPGVLRKEPS